MNVVNETNLAAVADDAADGVTAIAPRLEGTKGLAIDNLIVLRTQERMLCEAGDDEVNDFSWRVLRDERLAGYQRVVYARRYVTLLAGEEEVTATQR